MGKSPKAAKAAGTAVKAVEEQLPTLFSFIRGLEVSDGVMTALPSWAELDGKEVRLVADSRRGVSTKAYSGKDGGEKAKKGDEGGNPIFVQHARMPHDCSVLKVAFRVAVYPLPDAPHSSNSPVWLNRAKERLPLLRTRAELGDYARMFAYNIMNAAWGWRNREVADRIRVVVSSGSKELCVADDALDLARYPVLVTGEQRRDPNHPAFLCPSETVAGFEGFVAEIEQAMRGERGPVADDGRPFHFTVTGYFERVPGMRVFPSQLFIQKGDGEGAHKDPTLQYFKTKVTIDGEEGECLGFTSDKLMNALRTFDCWHGNDDFKGVALPFEPNGSLLRAQTDVRAVDDRIVPVLRDYLLGNDFDRDEEYGRMMYLIGCLVRGGLFNAPKKLEEKEKPAGGGEVEESAGALGGEGE